MKPLGIALFLLAQSVTMFAQVQARIEYGKPRDLSAVTRVYVWTGHDAALEAEVRLQFAKLLPMLELAESESDADVTLSVARKEQVPEAGKALPGAVTKSRLARARGTTIFLYVDGRSDAENLSEAVEEVLIPILVTFQKGNPRRFGTPPEEKRVRGKPRAATVTTTAGLRPGMSKKDVLASIGGPTRVDAGHGFTSVWMYETTDGTMRLVFGGDTLRSITVPEKK